MVSRCQALCPQHHPILAAPPYPEEPSQRPVSRSHVVPGPELGQSLGGSCRLLGGGVSGSTGENPPGPDCVMGTVLELCVAFSPEPCRGVSAGFLWVLPRISVPLSPPGHTHYTQRHFPDAGCHAVSHPGQVALRSARWAAPVSAGQKFRKGSLGSSGLGSCHGVAVR